MRVCKQGCHEKHFIKAIANFFRLSWPRLNNRTIGGGREGIEGEGGEGAAGEFSKVTQTGCHNFLKLSQPPSCLDFSTA